jgi:hypothetical protein
MLGKAPARQAGLPKLKDYVNLSVLAAPPASFGHDYLVGADWGMLGNGPDPAAPNIAPAGDCAIADALHQHLLWNREVGISIPLTPHCAIASSYTPSYD